MTDTYYDASNPIAAAPGDWTADYALQDAGTSFIGPMTVYSGTKTAIRASVLQQITVSSSANIRGATNGIEFAAVGTASTSNSIHNQGNISGVTGAGLLFSGGGTSYVVNQGTVAGTTGIKIGSTGASDKLDLLNSGTVSATELAIQGGSGNDRIINTGVLFTTGNTLMNLGKGTDLYDGTRGTASGKIDLGEGNDTAYGGAGSETFTGGLGNDYLDGGAGIDTADYSSATIGVYVDLSVSGWSSTGQGMDYLINIENLTGGADNDTLIGSDGDNVLNGGAKNDTLEGGLGSDTLIGGDGIDTARYNGSAKVYVNLENKGLQNTGHGYDLLDGIENVEGGSGSDTLIGDDANNKLAGNGGNDTLTGGEGNDTLVGGGGNNTAVFSGSRADYNGIPAVVNGTTPPSFTITHARNNTTKNDGSDQLTGIRFLKFQNGTATTSDDVIITLANAAPANINLSATTIKEDVNNNKVVGTLSGSDADSDTITYELLNNAGGRFKLDESGTKVLVAREDLLDYESATSHTIQVKAKDPYGGQIVKDFTITIQNVYETTGIVRSGTSASEQVVGEYGNDKLYGLDGNDEVFGHRGNDTVYGGNGNDYVIGGDGTSAPSGSDFLYGGNGKDTLVGGDGQDVFVFDAAKPNKSTNLDYIMDFNPRDDVIHLDRALFNKISKGTLSKGAFVVGDKAKDKGDRIIYHKTAGALFYDPDGTGKTKAVQFATIGKNLAITNKDFFIF